MAIGLTPNHEENIALEELTQEQFLVIAIESIKKIGWEIGYINDNCLIAYSGVNMMTWGSEIKINFENGTANIKSALRGFQLIDWGKNKKNIDSFVSVFNDLKSNYTPEELISKYEEEKITLKKDGVYKLPPPTTTGKLTNFFSIFKPTEGYYITPILVNLNVLVFILMIVSGVSIFLPDGESLVKWGANFRPYTLDGQPWRLITSCFVHIGIFHLLLNLYALTYIGLLLEPHLGKFHFLSAYILTGIIASVISLWWHDFTISAGASGAIFGMYGVFLAMLTTNFIEKAARKALLTSIAVFVGYNLINGLKDGIDNAAHIGGLISGLIIGYAIIPSLKNPVKQKLKLIIAGSLTTIVIIFSVIIYKTTPNDIGIYDAKMKEFTSMESMALEVYNLPQNTEKEKILYGIKDRGIYYWNENIKLLNEVNQLNIPIQLRVKNNKLKEYCETRIKCYELIYKMINEDTDKYNEEIENYNKQIDQIVSELQTI